MVMAKLHVRPSKPRWPGWTPPAPPARVRLASALVLPLTPSMLGLGWTPHARDAHLLSLTPEQLHNKFLF
eukprot:923810-Prymnesium_polylepis.1